MIVLLSMGTYNNPAMVRVLLLADSHLGFDFTFKPRVQRRRRGEDFFKNFHTALKPALQADCTHENDPTKLEMVETITKIDKWA